MPIFSQTITYKYDALGRLETVEDPVNGNRNYQYDPAGNRLALSVASVSSVAPSSSSSASSSPNDSLPPSSPGTPTISGVTATTASASWVAATDNVGVTAYEYRLNSGSWISVGALLSVNLTGLSSYTNYTFEVRARDAAGNNGSSSGNGFKTLDGAAPTSPGTPNISGITTTSASASWGAATDNVGVTAYEYRLNSGSWISVGISLSVNLSGLSPYTNYSFEVRARDASGNNGPSSSKGFKTLDGTEPSSPGTPAVSNVTATTAAASWTAATDNVGVTAYEYRLNSGSWISVGTSLSVNLTGLTSYTNYTFDVRARDASGNYGLPSGNTFKTLDGVPPSSPGMPTVSGITPTSALASWAAATDNLGVTGYEYRLNNGSWVSVGSSTGANMSGLTSATDYSLEVRARDAAGNYGASSGKTFRTLDAVQPLPAPYVQSSGCSAAGPGAYRGYWSAVPGAVGYLYRTSAGNEYRVYGLQSEVYASKCSWVRACSAASLESCNGTRAYFQ